MYPMKLPIEDDFNDVLGKAQKGLGWDTEELAKRAGIEESVVRALRRGEFDEPSARAVARVLRLDEGALIALALRSWYPEAPPDIPGFALIATPFGDLHVNAYLVWDPATKQAAAFDTGTDAGPMIGYAKGAGLNVQTLYLTHTHPDHIEGVEDLRRAFDCEVVVNALEDRKPAGATEIRAGYSARIGALSLEAIETTGHTRGGTTYLIGGLALPVAIAGDAIFAGSMGGANTSYADCIRGLETLLALDPDTALASGHGPLTTVAQERAHNCFRREAAAD